MITPEIIQEVTRRFFMPWHSDCYKVQHMKKRHPEQREGSSPMRKLELIEKVNVDWKDLYVEDKQAK